MLSTISFLAGPDIGGPHGPYRQSERTEIYNKLVQQLVDRDVAFPCFCTDEEIERARKEADARGLPPVYRGKWASASQEVPHLLAVVLGKECPVLHLP